MSTFALSVIGFLGGSILLAIGLTTGSMPGMAGDIDRSSQPWSFWFTSAFLLFVAIGSLLMAIREWP